MLDHHARRPFKAIKREIIESFERRYLNHVLEQHDFKLSAAAAATGLSRRELDSLVRKYGLHERAARRHR